MTALTRLPVIEVSTAIARCSRVQSSTTVRQRSRRRKGLRGGHLTEASNSAMTMDSLMLRMRRAFRVPFRGPNSCGLPDSGVGNPDLRLHFRVGRIEASPPCAGFFVGADSPERFSLALTRRRSVDREALQRHWRRKDFESQRAICATATSCRSCHGKIVGARRLRVAEESDRLAQCRSRANRDWLSS
jgi:hypothetical protein